MEAGRRWRVTYTKHVKQKRKIYQDGYLELQASGHKVMLYDEWEKILDSRFMKTDDVISSGETLAFDSYLVDIGELCGGQKPMSTLNCQEKENKLSEKSYRYGSKSNSFSVDMKPMSGKNKERVINLSPSKKMIRDFKKNEIHKYGSPPSCTDMTKTSTTEWQVLYTTQVTQKAKKFHDGFLRFVVRGSQGMQVMLYDECEKLLASRFVKKDDVISSGETLAFDSYLVNIGELRTSQKPMSTLNFQEKENNLSEKSESSYAMKPMFGKIKGRAINLSPSNKMIRDFKKSEINKYGSPPSCMDMTKTSTTEWQVLYTTQVTQKAKKFHDGFLQLVVRGSEGRQVKLYDTNRIQLSSRFLKKDEIVSSGETLAFEGFLVEIGETEEDHKPATDSILLERNFHAVRKNETTDNQGKVPTIKQFRAGKTPDKTSLRKVISLNSSSLKVENAKLSWSTVAIEPRRAVHDILSILRKPSLGNGVPVNEPFLEEQLESHASGAHSDIKKHIKEEHAAECGGSAQEELREQSDQNQRIKILKPEAAEVLVYADKFTAPENASKSEVGSTSFCLRSATANCIAPILNVEDIDDKKLVTCSSMEPQTPVTFTSDSKDQTRIESRTQIRLKENDDPEKPPHVFSEITSETNAAALKGLSSCKLPQLWEDGSSSRSEAAAGAGILSSNDCPSHDFSGMEEETPKQDFHTMETDDIPSFDLGF